MERIIDMMEETLKSANELNAQRRTRRTAGPSRLACGLTATYTTIRRQSRSRSNLVDSNQLATSRWNLAHIVTLSMYHASTTRVHGTRSVAAGCGRRSIRSTMPCALRKLPRLRTAASFKRPGLASPPTTRDLPGGASWWSQRTTHRGSARRISRKHVGSRPTQTTPTGGRRSSARRHPRVPATCISSSQRRVC
jgi:hypothetical protein